MIGSFLLSSILVVRLLIGVFGTFSFNVSVDMLGFRSAILIVLFCFFYFPLLLSFILFEFFLEA